MDLFRFLRYFRRDRQRRPRAAARRPALQLEALETRHLPSGNTIGGFVYLDANHNGLYDASESAFANNPISLLDSSNALVATTRTDANGYYVFDHDPRINTTPTTLTRQLAFASLATDWNRSQSLPQFDPSLGTLTEVDITNDASITSDIQVENVSNQPATVRATVGGTLGMSGPAVAGLVTSLGVDSTFDASAYDGFTNFGGTSGHDFGPQTARGSSNLQLSAPNDLALFTGTGSVLFTEIAHGASTATGPANLLVSVATTAQATVTVVYHYVPSNNLRPGTYTIVQTSEPPNTFDGWETAGNVIPLPNSLGGDSITVPLANTNLTNNDFGEFAPASLSGFVYADANNNGVFEPGLGETGIGGVTVQLTGTNDLGNPVALATTTAANGAYTFGNLRPSGAAGYTLTETQPAGWLDGKDAIGTPGGTAGNDAFSAIVLFPGVNGTSNNFGELAPASVSGFVYADGNNNGVFEPGLGEAGIGGVTVQLTGTDDLGNAVSLSTTTAATGAYSFGKLRPSGPAGYTLAETQPDGWLNGKDTIGTPGGSAAVDQFTGIVLAAAVNGSNNNFGELRPASLSGFVYLDANNNGGFEPDKGETGIGGVTVTLSGTDDRGNPVNVPTTTAADGSYQFGNLRPSGAGGYTLTETQPAGYLDGIDTIGTPGGTTVNDQFSNLVLVAGFNGANNDFGELPVPPPPPPPPPPPSPPTVIVPPSPPASPAPPPTAPAPPTVPVSNSPETPSKSFFLASEAEANSSTGAQDAAVVSSIGAFSTPGESLFVTGADAGGGPNVVVFDAQTKAVKANFFPYDPGFSGGVRVALGDVNGDGYPDLICAAGPGGGPNVKVFSGKDGNVLLDFFAYDPRFTGGVNVAVGDVNGDGSADIICGAAGGGGPNVTVFSGKDGSLLSSFFAYDPRFTGGVRVAAGDVNGDGFADVICGAGPGGGPNVTVFSGKDNGQTRLLSFFAYDPRFTPGIYVAAGDVNGDGKADVITGPGAGGGSNVAVFDGSDAALLESFFAYDPSFAGGVRVAAAATQGGNRADVITVEGPGGAPNVRAFSGTSAHQLDEFFAYNPLFRGGLFVGGV